MIITLNCTPCQGHFYLFVLGNLCSNLVVFSLARKILPFSQKLAFASFLPIRSALGAFPFTRSIFNRVSPVFLFRAWEPLFEFGRLFAYAQNPPFLSETCLRFLPPYSVGAWRVSLHPLHF